MNIFSDTKIVMVGANPIGFPCPALPNGTNVQMNYLACQNAGATDLYVTVGKNPGVTANSTSGTLVAAPTSAVQPGTVRQLSSLMIGPLVMIPVSPGDRYFSAVANPTSVVLADTGATASSGAMSLTVGSASGIVPGQTVQGTGIQAGTTVTSVVGTTIGISLATSAPLSNTEIQFSGVPSPLPPGILICALGV
jgi:hypothetical protein